MQCWAANNAGIVKELEILVTHSEDKESGLSFFFFPTAVLLCLLLLARRERLCGEEEVVEDFDALGFRGRDTQPADRRPCHEALGLLHPGGGEGPTLRPVARGGGAG